MPFSAASADPRTSSDTRRYGEPDHYSRSPARRLPDTGTLERLLTSPRQARKFPLRLQFKDVIHGVIAGYHEARKRLLNQRHTRGSKWTRGRRSKPATPSRRLADPRQYVFIATGYRTLSVAYRGAPLARPPQNSFGAARSSRITSQFQLRRVSGGNVPVRS